MTFAFRTAVSAATILMTALIPYADAAGPFDGTYAGTTTNTQAGGGAGCGAGGPGSRTVTDNVMTTQYASRDVRIKIGAGGIIDDSASIGPALVSFKGKITGNVMTYDITSQRCAFHFEGTKR